MESRECMDPSKICTQAATAVMQIIFILTQDNNAFEVLPSNASQSSVQYSSAVQCITPHHTTLGAANWTAELLNVFFIVCIHLTLGCVSTNSPMLGSSVKPWTPSPMENMRIVEEEYMQYPAATRLVLGVRVLISRWAASSDTFSPKSTRHSSASLNIPNMVPVTMPTSMLVAPSRGLNTATYLEFHASSTNNGWSSFSVGETTPIFPVKRKAFFSTVLDVSYREQDIAALPNDDSVDGGPAFTSKYHQTMLMFISR